MQRELLEDRRSIMTPLHITPEAHEKLMEVIRQNPTSVIRINEQFGGGG
jgi:hypothetical protein